MGDTMRVNRSGRVDAQLREISMFRIGSDRQRTPLRTASAPRQALRSQLLEMAACRLDKNQRCGRFPMQRTSQEPCGLR
jgi:hypothetical protein